LTVPDPEDVFVGVGSNLSDRRALIEQAVARMAALPATRLVARAALRETDPVGRAPQPRFLNTAVHLRTALEPEALLNALQEIEQDLGRVRTQRWGPRTIDLDILLFGDRKLDGPTLEVPHPRLNSRRFALEPLAELAPERIPPGSNRTVRQLLEALQAP
jgi:2-amino-4-hydroxy-6-hydroxymethyldihydropteridine diphosphokinase